MRARKCMTVQQHTRSRSLPLVSVIRFLKRSWFIHARCVFQLLSMVTVSTLLPPRAARRSGRRRRRGRCGAWNASSLPVHSARTRTRASLPGLRMRPIKRNRKRNRRGGWGRKRVEYNIRSNTHVNDVHNTNGKHY